MKSFCVRAPAKVNLFLHIIGKEKTGYHLIESLFVFANVSNLLEVKVSKKNSKYESSTVKFINSNFRIDIRCNTVIKAINLLLKYVPIRTKVSVKILKKIPIASGLGSGSSDAGAIIRTLGNIWKIDRSLLKRVALNVGADVPASIDSKPVLVRGIGEKLYPIKRFSLPTSIVLIRPKKKSLSTIKVFSKYKEDFSKPIEWNDENEEDLLKLLIKTKNDLQKIAISLVPEIKDVISALESQKGSILSRMSGSGVACFGIFDNKENARVAAANIRNKQPEWWVCNTQLIT